MHPDNEDLFSQDELNIIISKANELSRTDDLNSSWERVYLRLADAANELHAYQSRCMDIKVEGKYDHPLEDNPRM